MVLEEQPTQAVIMMMMMEMVMRRRTQRRLLATSQGRGSTVDYLQLQHIHNTPLFLFFFAFNVFLFPLANIWVWFETKDCI